MISFFGKKEPKTSILLYNTLGKVKQEFKPLTGRYVKMYTCGPTVYDYVTIGNLRSYIFPDILKRTLQYAGYEVKQIMNITDMGQLVGDGDEGEDKMTAGLKREGMALSIENMKVPGTRYMEAFISDLKELNIELPFGFVRAAEHVPAQIAFVESLFAKGYAYTTSDGVYFDTGKFQAYGVLGGTSAATAHSRVGVNAEKHHPQDFALWKFNSELGWDSVWGKGFPGWHIECTAMATQYLGKSFDIHTGGIDLIPIHHNNEIAQAEAATGKRYVNYWVHGAFITVEGKRIGKSEGNTLRLYQMNERGISALAYRYLVLMTHYRSPMNFTWDALTGAETSLYRALRIFADLPKNAGGKILPEFRTRFENVVYDDLNTPEALAIMWELLRDEKIAPSDKRETLLDFDRVLGIGFGIYSHSSEAEKLSVVAESDLSEDVTRLILEREEARKNSDWGLADILRNSLTEKGFSVEDTKDGPDIRRL